MTAISRYTTPYGLIVSTPDQELSDTLSDLALNWNTLDQSLARYGSTFDYFFKLYDQTHGFSTVFYDSFDTLEALTRSATLGYDSVGRAYQGTHAGDYIIVPAIQNNSVQLYSFYCNLDVHADDADFLYEYQADSGAWTAFTPGVVQTATAFTNLKIRVTWLQPGPKLYSVAVLYNYSLSLNDLRNYVDTNFATLVELSGYTPLDANRKVPLSYLPDAVVGGLHYLGTWNASSNTPALASGTGERGGFYKVSVAGTTALDGHKSWSVGDVLLYDGTSWDKLEGQDTDVVSVAGLVGAITTAALKTVLAITSDDVAGLTDVRAQDRYIARAALGLTGGGTISLSAAVELSWSVRLQAISMGGGGNEASPTVAYTSIVQPAAGVNVVGVAGAANRVATAAGIPLKPWEALYWVPVLFKDGGGPGTGQLLVAGYQAAWEPPPTAILVATINGDTPAVRLPGLHIRLFPGESYDTTRLSSATNAAAIAAQALLISANATALAANAAAITAAADYQDFLFTNQYAR